MPVSKQEAANYEKINDLELAQNSVQRFMNENDCTKILKFYQLHILRKTVIFLISSGKKVIQIYKIRINVSTMKIGLVHFLHVNLQSVHFLSLAGHDHFGIVQGEAICV